VETTAGALGQLQGQVVAADEIGKAVCGRNPQLGHPGPTGWKPLPVWTFSHGEAVAWAAWPGQDLDAGDWASGQTRQAPQRAVIAQRRPAVCRLETRCGAKCCHCRRQKVRRRCALMLHTGIGRLVIRSGRGAAHISSCSTRPEA